MARNGTRLPIPADIAETFVAAWENGAYRSAQWPRSEWLRTLEDVLRAQYPSASSADLRLTARGLAPFPLKDGPNVP